MFLIICTCRARSDELHINGITKHYQLHIPILNFLLGKCTASLTSVVDTNLAGKVCVLYRNRVATYINNSGMMTCMYIYIYITKKMYVSLKR